LRRGRQAETSRKGAIRRPDPKSANVPLGAGLSSERFGPRSGSVARIGSATTDSQATRFGFAVAWTFQRYNSPSDPAPIIRNEELILLRAEANIGLGNNSAAIADINVVRTKAGLLPPIADPYVPVGNQPPTLLDELLYEKRYSLVWENGDRWADLRHYGKLASLPKDRPGDLIFPRLQIPLNECVPRDPQPPGCQRVSGF